MRYCHLTLSGTSRSQLYRNKCIMGIAEHPIMRNVKFVSRVESLLSLAIPDEALRQIHQEQMLFNCSPDYATKHGGLITQHVMSALNENNAFNFKLKPSYMNWLVDVKVAYLQPGEYPFRPGWHCDGVLKSRITGQPDVDQLEIDVPNYLFMVGSQLTTVIEYVDQTLTIPIDTSRVWASVDHMVNWFEKKLSIDKMRFGEIHCYTQPTILQYKPAIEPGWVYIFKCSASNSSVADQLRQQVQIYTKNT